MPSAARPNRDARGQVVVMVARAEGPWRPCQWEHSERGLLRYRPPGVFVVESPDGARKATCGFHLDLAIIRGLPDG